ncbi:indole-diterpene biosynthesis protein PaxU [Glarea lozoyensis ATCC 20868]|uniref:Indole-diterpene biosynthesis protein PaxU n=1 Tax=Glarea lozoyensis (strain ATCC 20868 / MF5171) TaxID=1116229 RepID=S3D0F1_GLAL2|nr:indole-diterpene biosynthesis protein PaxU [Glarea lozoyensis ATCC 20868]EPE32012.1 indole-diterpene biosynthesis protein PaxU [Glarea lozoyensis ATCC 20868]
MATNTEPPKLEFTWLNPILSIYTPPPTEAPIHHSHPTTIIFCAWMGVSSRSRYLNSFYQHYHTLYPNARIISVRSQTGFFAFTSTSARLRLHEPIIAAIESDPAPAENRKIIAHVMSNGGALGFADICQLYKEKTGNKLNVGNVVFDSGPGEYTLGSAFHAFSQAFPKGLLWYPTAIFMWLVLVILGRTMFGPGPRLKSSNERLNDLNCVNENQRRLYMYSEVDRSVDWRSVVRHAKEAREKGVKSTLMKSEGSKHVQLMMRDPEKYWNIVWGFSVT